MDAVRGACMLPYNHKHNQENANAYAKDPKKLQTLLSPDDAGTRAIFGGAGDIGDKHKDIKAVALRMVFFYTQRKASSSFICRGGRA